MLNCTGVLAILMGIWLIETAPCISEVGENVYRISFRTEDFLQRAMEEGHGL